MVQSCTGYLDCMRFRTLSALVVLATVATGCASTPDPASVTGIPEPWLQDTADGWAESEAFGGNAPVLSNDPCELGDAVPGIVDEDPTITDSGWGSYGDDPTATDSYRYLCDFWSKGRYAGSLQLIQAPDSATADQTLQLFVSRTDTADQENTVTTVQAGQLEVHVLARWYPTNPQGEYQAMYLDTAHHALVVLEVNSLSSTDFAGYDGVAAHLLAALASGS